MDEAEIVKLKGWKFLDPEQGQELRGKAATASHNLDALAYRVFSGKDGQDLLKWMLRQTVMRPVSGPDEFSRGRREGQNDLVRQLLTMIERSKKGPRT